MLELGGGRDSRPLPGTWRYEEDHDGDNVDVPTLDGLRALPELLRAWDGDGELGPSLSGPAGIGGRYGTHPA